MNSRPVWLRSLLALPWRVLLASESIRRRLAFELTHRHHEDLSVAVPLGHGLVSPIFFEDAWTSFSQIFFEQEYDRCWESLPLPGRWLDLGCHAGYFSLYALWRRRRAGLSTGGAALLIDADPRVRAAVERLIECNGLSDQFAFLSGAIAPAAGAQDFVMGDRMTSRLASMLPATEGAIGVPVIGEAEILRRFPPPYDLIKADIEGAEHALLTAYPEVIRQTRHLVIEWHSWQPGGGGRAQIEELAGQAGFRGAIEVVPSTRLGEGPASVELGVLAFSR